MKTSRFLTLSALILAVLGTASCSDEPVEQNTAPVASFTMSPTCTTSNTDPVTFTSTSTDADGDQLACIWTFNSGTPGSSGECTVTGVTFPNVSPYNVILMVDDGNGGTATTSMSIGPC